MLQERVALWLKTHAAGEQSFARALRRFFAEQADRVADALVDNFTRQPKSASKNAPENFQATYVHLSTDVQKSVSPDQVSLIFNATAEHELLMPVVRRNIGQLMIQGALAELMHASKSLRDELIWGDLDQAVRERILATLRESTEQDYWREIQDGVAVDIRKLIEHGISEGYSTYKIGGLIRHELGGTMARKRATRIARTETTGALNAGHLEQMRAIGAAVDSKRWISIGDKDTRETHAAANGQSVRGVDSPFVIGGFEAPYPGHFSLPPQERVGCRCTVISVLNEDILAAAENPEFN